MPVPRPIAPGLWAWRVRHPDWDADSDFPPLVNSFAVRSAEGIVAVDPLGYPAGVLGEPVAVVVVKPDHVREAAAFDAPVYGSAAVAALLEGTRVVAPGDELPGGLRVHDDGRGRGELPLWAPLPRALLFADGLLSGADGRLRVWWNERYPDHVLPALRRLLELPIAHVCVGHGAPACHAGRAALAAALDRPPLSPPAGGWMLLD